VSAQRGQLFLFGRQATDERRPHRFASLRRFKHHDCLIKKPDSFTPVDPGSS
jgi:hypothetical protein